MVNVTVIAEFSSDKNEWMNEYIDESIIVRQ
jgi:hypothetical protein